MAASAPLIMLEALAQDDKEEPECAGDALTPLASKQQSRGSGSNRSKFSCSGTASPGDRE